MGDREREDKVYFDVKKTIKTFVPLKKVKTAKNLISISSCIGIVIYKAYNFFARFVFLQI